EVLILFVANFTSYSAVPSTGLPSGFWGTSIVIMMHDLFEVESSTAGDGSAHGFYDKQSS
ncbi:hypothetical protein TNCT_659911, partial [Trichonephila clavata]